jgi:hypothetical protein
MKKVLKTKNMEVFSPDFKWFNAIIMPKVVTTHILDEFILQCV